MLKSILVLPDGSELTSGTGTVDAICSIRLTQSVNDSRELSPGSVCSAMLEAEIFTPGGQLELQTGSQVRFYRELEGVRHDMGLFILEKPLRKSANTLSLTAYDRVSLLDKDLSNWLAGLTGWPYRLQEFAEMVCGACGLEPVSTQLPNGDFPVAAFTAQGITGRQLISWAAQAAGRFCRATADGRLEFAWYTPAPYTVGPEKQVSFAFSGGDLAITGVEAVCDNDNLTLTGIAAASQGSHVTLNNVWEPVYYMGGLQFEDYTVAPIEKVQVQQTQTDVGAVYPDVSEGNTYTVTGNGLLTATMAEALEPVAENLYTQLQGFSYTPCSISMPANPWLKAGDILTVTDPNGNTFTTCIMTKVQAGQKDTLTCTGSPRRDSSSAVNELDYKALSGKVLELQLGIEGIKAENRDTAGNLSALELELDGVSTQVVRQDAQMEELRQSMTSMVQDADSLTLRVQSIVDNGTEKITTAMGYTFDDDGLRISREGNELSTAIDHTGMEVSRSGETVLQATAQGVKAIDITVENYLVVGGHARLEGYSDGTDTARTACFFV